MQFIINFSYHRLIRCPLPHHNNVVPYYLGFQYQVLLGLGIWVTALALGLNQARSSFQRVLLDEEK